MSMNHAESDQPAWPYRSLILFGFWGPHSRSGKRLMLRSGCALLLFLVGFVGTQLVDSVFWTLASAAMMPAAILFMVHANILYIRSLDALETRIQLTAFSVSYGTALFIGFLLFAIHTATGSHVSPLWLLLAEPLRGVVLFVTSRKYQ